MLRNIPKKFCPVPYETKNIKVVDVKKRIKLLADVKKLLGENNIEFFPIRGTLLGFIRNREIMPWDVDIDLGVWYYDHAKITKLTDKFEKMGYKILIKPAYMSICFAEDFWNEKKGQNFIYVYDKEGWYYYGVHFHISLEFLVRDKDNLIFLNFFDENMFNRIFGRLKKNLIQNPNRTLSIKTYNFFNELFNSIVLFIRDHYVFPYKWLKETKVMEIYNMDFKIPSNYEMILENNYGKNWRIPIGTNRCFPKASKKTTKRGRRKYHIKDKNVRNLWIKRGNISKTN